MVIGVKCAATFDGVVPQVHLGYRARKGEIDCGIDHRFTIQRVALFAWIPIIETQEERWYRYGHRAYEESVHDLSDDMTAASLERS